MDAAEQYAALEKLGQDPDLDELGRQLSEFNLFHLLGIGGEEEKHSRVLAWLLNPRGNHQLGDAFLKGFLAATTGLELAGDDLSAVEVRREWRNQVDGEWGFLDILVLDEGNQWLCAIENKVWTGEHSRQLTRYRRALETAYSNYDRHYIFLSPRGTLAQDAAERGHWQPVGYEVVCQVVEETVENLADSISEAARVFLQQYAGAVRRGILGNRDTRVFAWKIYRQHKDAIEYINRERLNPAVEMDRILREVIRSRAGLGWKLEELHKQEGFTRFFPEEWQRFPELRTGIGWLPACPELVLFQFRCQNDTIMVDIAISEGKDEAAGAARAAIDGCIGAIIDPAKRQERSFRTHFIVFDLSDNILDESDFEQWDENAMRSKIEEWAGKFAEDEYPRIRDAVVQCLTEFEASRRQP